ncbi:hypothetical protein [Microvirga massiliensis]|uniref:hypothetical protein n=1 Tax=Microvirga massiliensis TaxID=1033741 RepID=UPI00062B8A59|nr:hypothetical protein [Microvirga massiliensis]
MLQGLTHGAAILLAPTAAFAQDTTVDVGSIFGALQPLLTEMITVLIAIALTWLWNLLRCKFGLEIEAKHREALQTSLTNAAGLIVARAGTAATGLRLDVRSVLLAEAVEYVLKAAPDALKHFDLTPESIREKLEAKIGVLAATNAPPPSAAAEPVRS